MRSFFLFLSIQDVKENIDNVRPNNFWWNNKQVSLRLYPLFVFIELTSGHAFLIFQSIATQTAHAVMKDDGRSHLGFRM